MKSDFQSYQILLLKMVIFQPKTETFKETGKYDSYTRRKKFNKQKLSQGTQISDLLDKDFKYNSSNFFKELKEIMSK